MKTTYQNLWAAAKAMLRGKNIKWKVNHVEDRKQKNQ